MLSNQFLMAFAGLAFQATSIAAAPTASHSLSSRQSSVGRVSAWWGQVPQTVDLADVCAAPDIDIVMMSFLNHFFADGAWPSLNFGAYTMGPSDAQKAAGANNLTDGSNLVQAITACQSSGKKVYLSLGGDAGHATTAFNNDDEASAFADNLWSLFLGGTGNSTTDPIRPFGSVVLDGIDIDTENATPEHYDTFITQLRSNMASDSSHSYGISAVPECTGHSDAGQGGDASLPDNILQMVDDVFIQFYNNQACLHGLGDPFTSSVTTWSGVIGNAKLWIGTPVTAESAPLGGYVSIDDVTADVQTVLGLNLPNLGGYALWDASLAINSKNAAGDEYNSVVKKALQG